MPATTPGTRTQPAGFTPARTVALWAAVAWVGVGLVKTLEHVMISVHNGGLPLITVLRDQLPIALCGWGATIPLFMIADRYPLGARHPRRNLAIVAGAIIGATAAILLVRPIVWQLIAPHMMGGSGYAAIPAIFHIDLLNMVLVAGLAHVAVYMREREQEARNAAHLRSELVEARLHTLQAQIHPHFLFNTLHTVAQLTRTGRAAESVHVVELLGDLLRSSLNDRPDLLVPLAEELQLARTYLEIEHIRFADRLQVVWDVERETAATALVPQLVLQPLIENAIRHGISPTSSAGRIEVTVRRTGDRLQLMVCDDGVGLRAHAHEHLGAARGVGVSNTRARLHALFGPTARLELRERAPHGTEAFIDIPFTERSAVRA